MRLLPALFTYLQMRFGSDPVDYPTDQRAYGDCPSPTPIFPDGGVPTPPDLTTFHDERR